MLNSKLLQQEFLMETHKSFLLAKPFKYVVINNFIEDGTAKQLSVHFPTLEKMNVSYNGINEKKTEHSAFAELNIIYKQLKDTLFKDSFVKTIEQITGVENLQLIDDRYGYGLHQGGKGSFLDIHIDYNLHPLKRMQRRFNLILFLSESWDDLWGGNLQFWNADVTKCIQSLQPQFNTCVLFECNEISYHGYNEITCPENITRKSFYLYFFSQPANQLSFHDTMFKPTPADTKLKKIKVIVKEQLKNTLKRFLYNLKWSRFFK